ncbi:hypothetical protein JNW90_21010 [Micromonospora sp. STR1s_5]|nr:hypothetical protein [Micromonospora sp. STR1s_5]
MDGTPTANQERRRLIYNCQRRLALVEERAKRCRGALKEPLDRDHAILLQGQVDHLDKLAAELRTDIERLLFATTQTALSS